MRTQRATVTAAITLVVAAVTAASAAWALANGPDASPEAPTGFGSTELGDSQPRSPEQGPSRAPAQQASAGAARSGQSAPPDRVEIPALGVGAPIVPTGVTKAGNAQIPRDGDVVGWYEFGSAPGAVRGNAVLIGHRDTDAEGPGALFDLDLLTPGATISVSAGRQTIDYRVIALRSVEKAGLPASLFRRTGPPRLVVITCGGAFLPESGGYQENLYAVAVPRKG
jgi:sortase (surface protein transpeptidase)